MMGKIIGIDIGTSYSSVGVFQNGKIEIIANYSGKCKIPSYIAFTNTGLLVGDAAKEQIARNSTNTVFNIKRLIGRKLDDPSVVSEMKHWPFHVFSDAGKPKTQVEYKGEIKTFYPEEISSMIFTKLKETAEAYLGRTVNNAVVTVPACFNDSQRQATKDAATIAGLNVMRIISEPTAAALTYGLDKKGLGDKNVLIFDLGAGSLDVSIVTIDDDGIFEVKSTAGNAYLGGENFDVRMVNHFIQRFYKMYRTDLTPNKRSLVRLRKACENAKIALSTTSEASIKIDSLFDDKDLRSTISRTEFEELCADLFKSILEPVEKSLCDAQMNKSHIHEIILVGGSTRIPKIQKQLQEFFDGRELNKSIQSDESVSYGAALQAAIQNHEKHLKIEKIILLDVAPFSLGIETDGGVFTAIIKRNSTIPFSQTQSFTIRNGNLIPISKTQPKATNKQVKLDMNLQIKVYTGEHAMTTDNNLLGILELKIKGSPEIAITFDIDAECILNVSAMVKHTGKQNKITIDNGLSNEEIDEMKNKLKQYRREDEKLKENILARDSLKRFLSNLQLKTKEESINKKISLQNHIQILDKILKTFQWLANNQNAEKEEYEFRQKELQYYSNAIMTK